MAKKQFNKLLLVEGNDDKHVMFAICEKFKIKENFTIIDCTGIEKLYTQIPVRFKQSGIDTIGIIVDADIDLQKRWLQLLRILNPIFDGLPKHLPKEGLIHESNDKKIGVWVMPNNITSGMLEDFIQFLVPDEDVLLPIVKQHLDAIEIAKQNKYRLIHRTKAEIHAWLALQEDPETPMGLSITKRYLTLEREECKNLVKWLSTLFKE